VVSSRKLEKISEPIPDPLKKVMVLVTILWALVIGLVPLWSYMEEINASRAPTGQTESQQIVTQQKALYIAVYQGVVWPTVVYAIVLLLLMVLSSARERGG
jgi:hypothetical protein